MLQIRISPDQNYSLAEMAQMALEGGARWLVLAPGDESDFRDTGMEISQMCREAGVILTLEGSIDMARELGLHGIYVPAGASVPQARADMGPEAIIGTLVASAESALALEKADIDYVTLPADTDDARAAGIIEAARRGGCTLPFVAVVDGLSPRVFAEKSAAGFSGFVAVDGVFDSADPVALIKESLALL